MSNDYDNSPMEHAIDECIHNDMHRLILKRRLLDGWTYDRISQLPEINRTSRQIGNILAKHTPKLFDYLRSKTS